MIIKQKLKSVLRRPYHKLKWQVDKCITCKNYHAHKNDRFGLTETAYQNEYKKYLGYCRNNPKGEDVRIQIKEFFKTPFYLCSDSLTLSDDPCDPIVISVIKNEYTRMQLFFEHYKKLGIHQFIILDNGSTDGALEWLSKQPDTRVYQVKEPFQTHKKESWIQKILALTGYDRWYIVVDADELLDYTGSEQHSVNELIRHMHSCGHRRLWGYMLDMYSDKPLFSEDCAFSEITDRFCYFDCNYYLDTQDRKSCNSLVDYLYGGPRYAILNLKSVQSKQSVFFFSADMLYRNCHFMQPVVRWGDVPCCYVLRHHKYLKKDEKPYRQRIEQKSFAGNSVEYKKVIANIEGNSYRTLLHENSVRYVNSGSLRCLPYLEFVDWDKKEA